MPVNATMPKFVKLRKDFIYGDFVVSILYMFAKVLVDIQVLFLINKVTV